MSDNKMTPECVVENFLPDFENRIGYYLYDKCEHFMEYDENCGLSESEWDEINKSKASKYFALFTYYNFPEALNHLLQAQREICEEKYHEQLMEVDAVYYRSVANAILSSPIPEPLSE